MSSRATFTASAINHDRLERQGSGYVARHEPDFLMANDPWFRGLELKYGPDGAVYITDWYDTGECHENRRRQRPPREWADLQDRATARPSR